MIARFNIVSPPAKRRSFTVRLPILVGRGDEAKFRIQHDLISRKHCEFFHRDGVVYVRDLGSTNGTFLNEEQIPLSTKTRVPSGAKVRVGGLSFTVDYHSEAAGQPAAETADDQAAGQTDVTFGASHAGHDAGLGESELLAVEHVAAEHAAGEDVGQHGEQPAADEPVDFMDAASAESPAEPPAEVEPEAVADLTEKLAKDQEAAEPAEPAADQPAISPPLEPLAAPPATGFDFLAAEQPPAEPVADAEWPSPTEDAAAEPPDDDLNNFFKGLK